MVHEEKKLQINQHAARFRKKKNQHTLFFMNNKSACNEFHKQKTRASNMFLEEKYQDKISFMTEKISVQKVSRRKNKSTASFKKKNLTCNRFHKEIINIQNVS